MTAVNINIEADSARIRIIVTFILSYSGEETNSNAEQKMNKKFYVLHSLGVPKHQSRIRGEIDFVVVYELGNASFAIKGRRVERKNGK